MHQRFTTEKERAERHGQEHIFRFWIDLTDEQKLKLLEDSEKIDYGFIGELYTECVKEKKEVKFEHLEPPISVKKYPHTEETEMAKKIGEDAIKNHEMAIFLVAGGQGSRLGFDGPKGCFPGTPITGKPLFRTFAEKIIAKQKKYNVKFDWFIMTSDENRVPTEKFFENNKYFNLDKEQIHFFTQESLPAVDINGKILMKSKYEIFFSPNGTGGIYSALKNTGMLDIMQTKEIKYLTFVQVDNTLSEVADAVYLGSHILTASEITPKVIPKSHAHDAIGLVVKADGVQRIIEYFMLSKEDAEKLDDNGELMYKMGNTGKLMLSVDYIDKVAKEKMINFIGSMKKVQHIDEEGNTIIPEKPNAYKFESFVFDPMPKVRSVAFEVKREEEYGAIKNAEGADSPKTAYEMQTALSKEWLRHAGIPDYIINNLKKAEISPLFALDKEEFTEKLKDKLDYYTNLLKDKEEYYFE
jgi:UDP-N-acetylglucosamine/UDP-N-acetylgalactosamine diphosphorylase